MDGFLSFKGSGSSSKLGLLWGCPPPNFPYNNLKQKSRPKRRLKNWRGNGMTRRCSSGCTEDSPPIPLTRHHKPVVGE